MVTSHLVRLRLALAAATLGALAMAVASACSDDDSPDGRSACSTGPAYVDAGQFALGNAVPGDHPDCIPRCSADTTPGRLSITQVPSGACTVAGEICNLGVIYPCGDAPIGREDEMQCVCTSGQWRCFIATQGAGICVAAIPDARAD